MTRTLSAFSFIAALCVVAAQVHADSIVIAQIGTAGQRTRGTTAAESSGGAAQGGSAPVDGDVYQWRVTTDGDILSVSDIRITLTSPVGATLYNNTFGDAGNANAGNPALVVAFPPLAVDSWIDTPGIGTRLGPDLPGDGTTTVGDTTNDGAQANFVFAQLTVPKGTVGTFVGKVGIAGGGGSTVFSQAFNLAIGIPEPASAALACFGLMGVTAFRRRMAR